MGKTWLNNARAPFGIMSRCREEPGSVTHRTTGTGSPEVPNG